MVPVSGLAHGLKHVGVFADNLVILNHEPLIIMEVYKSTDSSAFNFDISKPHILKLI